MKKEFFSLIISAGVLFSQLGTAYSCRCGGLGGPNPGELAQQAGLAGAGAGAGAFEAGFAQAGGDGSGGVGLDFGEALPAEEAVGARAYVIPDGAEYVAGEILVVYGEPESAVYASLSAAGEPGEPGRPAQGGDGAEYAELGGESTVILSVDPGGEQAAINDALSDPDVLYAQPNFIYENFAEPVPEQAGALADGQRPPVAAQASQPGDSALGGGLANESAEAPIGRATATLSGELGATGAAGSASPEENSGDLGAAGNVLGAAGNNLDASGGALDATGNDLTVAGGNLGATGVADSASPEENSGVPSAAGGILDAAGNDLVVAANNTDAAGNDLAANSGDLDAAGGEAGDEGDESDEGDEDISDPYGEPARRVPNDPQYSANQQKYMNLMNAEQAWALPQAPPAEPVKVAVIDTGLRLTHEDIQGQYTLQASTANLQISHADSSITDVSANSHGTHVAGTIAAAMDNGLGIAGVAPNCKIVPIKAGDTNFTTSSVIRGIDYAISVGAGVISMSLGGNAFDRLLLAACVRADAAGAIVVAAAGNDGNSADPEKIKYPAGFPTVISVSSVDGDGHLSQSSSYNAGVDIAAPGVGIHSLSRVSDSGYSTLSGTSQAAAVAAGVCALILEHNPGISSAEAKRALLGTAADAGDPGYDIKYGYGIIDAYAAAAAPPEKYDAQEPNDVFALATALGTDASVVSKLAFADDTDVYRLTVPEDGTGLLVEVTAPADLAIFEPYLTAADGAIDLFTRTVEYTNFDPADSSKTVGNPDYLQFEKIEAGQTFAKHWRLQAGEYYLSLSAYSRGTFSDSPYTIRTKTVRLALDELSISPDMALEGQPSVGFNASFSPAVREYRLETTSAAVSVRAAMGDAAYKSIKINGAPAQIGAYSQSIALAQAGAYSNVSIDIENDFDPSLKTSYVLRILRKAEPPASTPTPAPSPTASSGGNSGSNNSDSNNSDSGSNGGTASNSANSAQSSQSTGGQSSSPGGGSGGGAPGGGAAAPTPSPAPAASIPDTSAPAGPASPAQIDGITAKLPEGAAAASGLNVTQSGGKLVAELEGGTDGAAFELDLQKLRELSVPPAKKALEQIELRVGGISVYIQASALLGEQGAADPANGGSPALILSVSLKKAAQSPAMVQFLAGKTVAGGPYSIKMALADESGVARPSAPLSSYMAIDLPLVGAGEADNGKLTAVSFDSGGAAAAPEPRSYRLIKKGGEYYARVSALTSGLLVVYKNPASFADMQGHWAQGAVEEAGARSIVEGVGGGLFSPESDVTRAQFVAMAVRALGARQMAEQGAAAARAPYAELPALAAGSSPAASEAPAADALYPDVSADDWHYEYIAAARNMGLLSFATDGAPFEPNAVITREEMAQIVYSAAAFPGPAMFAPGSSTALSSRLGAGAAVAAEPDGSALAAFSDASGVGGAGRDAISYCVGAGILTGTTAPGGAPGELLIDANGKSTRAQAATIILRTLKSLGFID